MKCDKCLEYIFTDFTDGELSPVALNNVERHLETCAGCSAARNALLRDVAGPLRNSKLKQPGDHVWAGIKQGISTAREYSIFEKAASHIKGWYYNNRALYYGTYAVLAAAAVIFVLGIIHNIRTDNNIYLAEHFLRENVEYVSYLNYNGISETDSAYDFGTQFEEILF